MSGVAYCVDAGAVKGDATRNSSRSLPEAGDGRKEYPAVSDRGHAKPNQVLSGEFGQDRSVDVVGLERLRVALEPEIAEPGSNVQLDLLGTAVSKILRSTIYLRSKKTARCNAVG